MVLSCVVKMSQLGARRHMISIYLKKEKKKKKVGQVCCGNESLRLWRGLLTTTGASALGNHSPFLKWKHFCNVQADTRLQ